MPLLATAWVSRNNVVFVEKPILSQRMKSSSHKDTTQTTKAKTFETIVNGELNCGQKHQLDEQDFKRFLGQT